MMNAVGSEHDGFPHEQSEKRAADANLVSLLNRLVQGCPFLL